MNKKTTALAIASFLIGWLFVVKVMASSPGFDPDVEIKIPGLVCSSCAIGVKNGFKKTKLTKVIKFDTKKQLCFIEFVSIHIHPSEMTNIVRKAGYEIKSIKWLKDRKPNRYNKP